VLGFARVPVLSRLVVYSLAVSFALLSSSLSALFSFWTLLLFGLLKNMNSLLKLFSLSGFVVGYMFLVFCIKLDSHFDFIVSLLGLWFLFFPGLALLFFFPIGVVGLSYVSVAWHYWYFVPFCLFYNWWLGCSLPLFWSIFIVFVAIVVPWFVKAPVLSRFVV